MLNESQIYHILSERGLPLSGRIISDIFDETHFYVFVVTERDENNHQVPSNRKLDLIANEFKNNSMNIEFILTGADNRDVEAGVRASLLHSFGDFVRNSFLSVVARSAHIWIEPKGPIPANVLSEIKDKLKILLDSFGLSLGELYFTSAENLPSKFACLNIIRLIAPADLPAIADKLKSKGFSVPSHAWMSRMLDNLRKSGLIVRLKSGGYALSMNALKSLGTAKNRNSPDITRILALAKSGD
ncbi:hypothetical protein OE766_04945 [Pararhizobium sp. YC-54]|uniref:hypothetical protein n=1 Tax=Pararhizobium sp. YC-54 TaxID=2986920 RepID=UPI0021F79C01|nr:hypothetical protein [Pararhizobium sp. YC-54]MCV9997585.1 hypothetical protein [Pararhizobium sp. YC-54]